MSDSKPILCIWHEGCLDGFGAAWTVVKALGERNVELVGGVYGKTVPSAEDVRGRDVYIVDFSYDEATLRALAEAANSLTVLDHHKTAKAAIETLLLEGVILGRYVEDKSGALLTHEWFFPNAPAPALIEHISDRDLWTFRLEGTREVCAALFSYPMTIEVWNDLMRRPVSELVSEGRAIDRAHLKKIEEYIQLAASMTLICGHVVPLMNCPPAWASDAGNILCKGHPFSATYWINEDGFNFSLRSEQGVGLDVSLIAKAFGGGGHENAAGFRLFDLNELADTTVPGLPEAKPEEESA